MDREFSRRCKIEELHQQVNKTHGALSQFIKNNEKNFADFEAMVLLTKELDQFAKKLEEIFGDNIGSFSGVANPNLEDTFTELKASLLETKSLISYHNMNSIEQHPHMWHIFQDITGLIDKLPCYETIIARHIPALGRTPIYSNGNTPADTDDQIISQVIPIRRTADRNIDEDLGPHPGIFVSEMHATQAPQ